MTTGTIKYSQEGSLTGGGQTTTTGTGAGKPAGPAPAPAGPNFSSVSGAQQQVAPNGQVLNSTPTPNMSTPAPNFSSINGQQVYVPPPNDIHGNVAPSTNGTYRAATPMEQVWASPPGEFISGLKETFTNPGNTGQTLMTGSPASSAGALTGVLGQIYGMKGSAEGVAALEATQVSTISKIGTLGRAGKLSTTAGSIASNTKTAAQTTSWLAKVASASTNPVAVASMLTAAIGSYPFAGFLKEEALQTLGFATKSALDKGDLAGAQSALDMQKEVLHPDTMRTILAAIPYTNVISALKDFFSSAELKVNIDQRIIENMRRASDAGSSNPAAGGTTNDFWSTTNEQRAAEKEQSRKDDEEYYKQVADRMAEAKAASRAEDEAYWKKITDGRAAEAERKRKEEDAYWAAYYKRVDELRKPQAASYSKLTFGLLK